MSAFVGGIVPEEDCWNVVFGYLRTPDFGSFRGSICHARPDTGANHSKFQLTEYTRHLQESLTHRVGTPLPAIKGNGTNNEQPQTLLPHTVDDVTQDPHGRQTRVGNPKVIYFQKEPSAFAEGSFLLDRPYPKDPVSLTFVRRCAMMINITEKRGNTMKKWIATVLVAALMMTLLAGCGKSQAVKDAEAAIAAIGEVTADSLETIEKAERLYGFLTEEEKAAVENKTLLAEARYAYDSLQKDTLRDMAKEAYELIRNAAEIYIFNAHGLNAAARFGETARAMTMDKDFCKRYAEASCSVLGYPQLTEQEVQDALDYYYEEKGLSGNMKADKFFCMSLFNRALVFIRGYKAPDVLEKAGVILLELQEADTGEKYYPLLKEYFDFAATGNDFNMNPNNFTQWIGEFQSGYSQLEQEIKPLFAQ